MKTPFAFLFLTCLSALLIGISVGCTLDDSYFDIDSEDSEGGENIEVPNGDSHESADDYTWDESTALDIVLLGNSITTNAEGVFINGTTATITKAATYRITGNLDDGRIVVISDEEETVKLVLDGVNIKSGNNSPLSVVGAAKTVIILPEGTGNYLTDASEYNFSDGESNEPDAALFSDDDLTIFGPGKLTVVGNYNEAIKSKEGLIIKDAELVVTSADDGIQGKDYLIIKGGNYHIDVKGDGLKSNNDEDAEFGYITIEGGSFYIISESDGLQAETNVTIAGGDFVVITGGGSDVILHDDVSAKGIKGAVGVIIEANTTIEIDAADDAIHSDRHVTINGGTLTLASGDDAIHSDDVLEINGGRINIIESEEGIEGAAVVINDGEIYVVSYDDAVNAAGDDIGRIFTVDINGGYLVINASGDGIDANGNITMTGGMVIVNGPSGRGNGAIDYDREFNISGGFLLGVGSRDMVQGPGSNSSQNSLLARLNSSQPSGQLIHIEKEDGTELFTFESAKSYQSVVFSSPELNKGDSYKLYFGGSSDGTPTDGLYNGGTYNGGSLYNTFTISNIVTVLN